MTERAGKMPELLLPAGSIECVYAAVENGCTAVYAGASEFSARKNAENFTACKLQEAVNYCRLRGVKLYVAANTLIKDSEIQNFLSLAESVYEMGADGIIVQDIGCAAELNRRLPNFYMLASTQMTAHSLSDVEFLSERGFSRIILSRELSINEIEYICENSRADIECFIHGALCVCYSGQCLLSSFNGAKTGERSGNRGACAQPCRLEYSLSAESGGMRGKTVLSPKDMMGLHSLPALIESGVKSLKIEGRMKSAEYVAACAKIYRRYIDLYAQSPENYIVDEKDIYTLAAIFNRGGFSGGYFDMYAGKSMITVKRPGNTGVLIGTVSKSDGSAAYFKTRAALLPGDGVLIANSGAYITRSCAVGEVVRVVLKGGGKAAVGERVYRTYDKGLMDELKRGISANTRRLGIKGIFKALTGEPLSFRVECRALSASVEARGGIPAIAENKAVSRELAEKQLRKTGDTAFKLEALEILLDEGLFINITQLNEIRRDALAKLETEILRGAKRDYVNHNLTVKVTYNNEEIRPKDKKLSVLVRSSRQLKEVSKYRVSRVYIDFDTPDKEIINRIKEGGAEVFRCLQRIERDCSDFSFDERLDEYGEYGEYDGCLVRTYGQAHRLKKTRGGRELRFAVDYTLNVFNCESFNFWIREKCGSVCVSPELDHAEIGESGRGVEVLCYGRPVVMTTVQCPVGNFLGSGERHVHCGHKGRPPVSYLEDANGKRLDLMPVCDAKGVGCHCLVLASEPVALNAKAFPNGKFEYARIELTNENDVDVNNIMSTYVGLCQGVRR